MIETDPRRTAVYRFYDTDGSLLYVGVAVDPKARWYGHAQDKPWWPDVAVKEIEWFDGRSAAERAEIKAIQDERPRYNIHPTFWPKAAADVDPDEPGIDFVEWVRRMARKSGYHIGVRGAASALARAGGIPTGTVRYFFEEKKAPKFGGFYGNYAPEPPSVVLLRAFAKAFDMPISAVMIRAGVASAEDFTRGLAAHAENE